MAADMIKTILAIEAQAKDDEFKAQKASEKIIQNAKMQADIIIKSAIDQANNEANVILSDAEFSATGILKQASKLAAMREKKSISNTEKQYQDAINFVFDEIMK